MLNRVLVLRVVEEIRGNVVSSLPLLPKGGETRSIAFLCFCFFLSCFHVEGGENRCFKSGLISPLMGRGAASFRS